MNGLKVAKLISGEFIIGQVHHGYIMNVMLVHFMADNKTGQIKRTVIPYMTPITDTVGLIVGFDKIIAVVDAPEDLITTYAAFMSQVLAQQKATSETPQMAESSNIEPNNG